MVENSTIQDILLEECDEEQLEEYECMYVLVPETEALNEVVEGALDETTNSEQKNQNPLHGCPHNEAKVTKDSKKEVLLKWAQKQEEKVELEIEFMQEEHRLKMEKLNLEIERLSKC